jgi:hypothetical protein
MILVLGVWTFLRALLGRSAVVTLENVALRHQLAVLQRSVRRPRLRRRNFTGAGSPDQVQRVARRSTLKSAG